MATSYYKKTIAMALLCAVSASNIYPNTTRPVIRGFDVSQIEASFSCKNILAGTALLGLVAAGGYYLWNWYTRSTKNNPSEWQHPCNSLGKEHPTKAVFAPALFQSEMTTAYYTGSYTATTGETFTCTDPFTVLNAEHTVSCNFCEICPIKNNQIPLDPAKQLGHFSQLFSSALGLRDLVYQRIMQVTCDNPNPTESIRLHEIDFNTLNIAQSNDIQRLSDAYDHSARMGSDMVMYGFSRGAATTFNFLATAYKRRPHKRVKAAIIAGCFDSMEHVLACKLGKQFAPAVYSTVMRSWPALGRSGRNKPIDLAQQFPHDIPLLIVASKKDAIVPYDCSVALYKKLKETGHKQVYLLTLENAGHAGHLFKNDAADRTRYLHTVHAFYKHCGLSYIPAYAQKGEAILATCMAA